MRKLKALAIVALALASATTAFGQRPAESYGNKGGRPADAPQRPAGSWEKGRQRPADAPQRPAESRGKRGGRPENVPGRPR